MKKILFLLLFISLRLFALSQQIIYVNQAVQGGLQNGESWNKAFSDLQQALAIADPGDQIWVAEGLYFPTQGVDQTVSFVMKPGVALYGGFSGIETQLNQRDWEFFETILSGNIGNATTREDNSYHVLLAIGLDSTAILDGFTVSDGNALDPVEHQHGGGLLILPSQVAENTNPQILNCQFIQNRAFFGGAISCYRILNQDNYINPILRDCRFVFNQSTLKGGAFYKNGPALPNLPFELLDCTFSDNHSVEGGGVFIENGENHHLIRNCTFERDTASFGAGGALYVSYGYGIELNNELFLTLENSFFNHNYTEQGATFECKNLIPNNASFSLKSKIFRCEFNFNICIVGNGSAYRFESGKYITMDLDVSNCSFWGNQCWQIGGNATVISINTNTKCTLNIRSCKYLLNRNLQDTTATSYPINLWVSGIGGEVVVRVENCLFNQNVGALNIRGSEFGCKINSEINNCTFLHNSNSNNSVINCSYFEDFNGIDEYIKTRISNCLFWEFPNMYKMFGDNDPFIQTVEGYDINNTMANLDVSWFNAFPETFGPNMISNFTPKFTSVAANDFSLLPCALGVDAGDNQVPDTTGLLFDLAGNPRIFHGRVDMGAYETQDSCPTSLVTQPNNELPIAHIQPNPVAVKANVLVKMLSTTPGSTKWMLRDQSGRLINRGVSELEEFKFEAPAFPGIYTLELKIGNQKTFEKLAVFD